MKGPGLLLVLLALAGAISASTGACNDQGACPAKAAVMPGGACSGDQLQCPFDLTTESAACDSTTTVIASSCTCTQGAWACPSPFNCDGGAPATEDGAAPADGAADGASEAETVDAGAADALVEAAP
jgi:hypothetical protein